jgi:uncharacterized protein (TIGR02246 family)
LAIIAGFQWLQAERQRQSAEKNAALALFHETMDENRLSERSRKMVDSHVFAPLTNTSDQQLREQLVPLDKKIADAWKNNDAAALAALYTEDAIKVTPQGPIHGRQAIEKWLAQVFQNFHPKNYISKTDSLRIIGRADNIAANGEWSQTLQGKNGEPIPIKGYWSVIFVRQGEDWKILVDAFNDHPPPAPAASPTASPSSQ